MLRQKTRLLELGIRTADVAALSAAFPIAYLIRDGIQGGTLPGLFPIETYWPVLVLTLLLWLIVSGSSGVYEPSRTRPIATELFRIARAMAVVACILSALAFLMHERAVSRLFLVFYFTIGVVLLAMDRLFLRAVARVLGHGFNTRRYAVVGCSEFARDVVRNLERRIPWGYEFAGFVVDGPAPAALAPSKILGVLGDLPRILRDQVLDEAIFALPRERLDDVEAAVELCHEQGISARVCIDFFTGRAAYISVDELMSVPVLSFTRTPSDAVALAAKRVFDVVFSGLALVLLAPVFVIIAIAISVDSPGPVLFRQTRVGLNGRLFSFNKFRSMYDHAERGRDVLVSLNEADGPVFKIRKDPRITRVGAVLRRTSLDELPQFWNVLRGEMSIVGPRPPLPAEVQKYERWQRRRISMKPGITCTWQVSGRSDLSFDRWMELDLQYIDTWSLWQDVKICARTVPAVLSGRGAH